MKKSVLLIALICFAINSIAQNKRILLDISHHTDSAYMKVNPNVFTEYKTLVEDKVGAELYINKSDELTPDVLANVDVLIIPSPLDKDRVVPKRNLTATERKSIVEYVQNGGKLIFLMDEEDRVDMNCFGANDIVKPFGMEYGADLPMERNIGAHSIISEIVQNEYELSYSGSRTISGGTPISYKNGNDNIVHGAYVKLDNGGTIVAFAETMTGIFMGGVTMKIKDGTYITWNGKDDKAFIQDIIEWLLKQ